MHNAKRLGAPQVICLLFTARIFNLLLYTPLGSQRYMGTVSMAAFFGAGLLSIFLARLLQGLMARYRVENLLQLASLAGVGWGKCCALVIGSVLFLVAVSTLVNFQYFLSLAVYPGFGPAVFVLAMAGAVAYGVYMGIEALSRFAVPVVILVVLSLALAIAVLAGDVQLVFLRSPLQEGWRPIALLLGQSVLHNTELLLFLLLAGDCPNHGRGLFARTMAGSMLCYQLVLFLVTTTLGSYGAGQRFPVYSMMASADLSILQRLDFIHIVVWIFISYLKCALYLYGTLLCLQHSSPKVTQGRGAVGLSLAMAVCALGLLPKLSRMMTLWRFQGLGLPFILAVLMVPVCSAVLIQLRGRGRSR